MQLEPGSVFAIPIAEGMFGFGQLIAWQKPIFYMVAYDVKATSAAIDEATVRQAEPVLAGNFFDILIQNGHWPVVRTLEPRKLPFPCFKIKIGDKFFIESWDKRRQREATSEECAHLPFRTNHSAIIFEDALKAHFGLKPWEPKWFDALKIETIVALSKKMN